MIYKGQIWWHHLLIQTNFKFFLFIKHLWIDKSNLHYFYHIYSLTLKIKLTYFHKFIFKNLKDFHQHYSSISIHLFNLTLNYVNLVKPILFYSMEITLQWWIDNSEYINSSQSRAEINLRYGLQNNYRVLFLYSKSDCVYIFSYRFNAYFYNDLNNRRSKDLFIVCSYFRNIKYTFKFYT